MKVFLMYFSKTMLQGVFYGPLTIASSPPGRVFSKSLQLRRTFAFCFPRVHCFSCLCVRQQSWTRLLQAARSLGWMPWMGEV